MWGLLANQHQQQFDALIFRSQCAHTHTFRLVGSREQSIYVYIVYIIKSPRKYVYVGGCVLFACNVLAMN